MASVGVTGFRAATDIEIEVIDRRVFQKRHLSIHTRRRLAAALELIVE